MKRCGAKTKRGGICKRPPEKGATRCKFHGARQGVKPIHGRYSKRFARIEPAAQRAIDAALSDPELLDARRPVALHQVLIENTALVPTNEAVFALAKARSRWRPREGQTWEDQPEPTQAELDLASLAWSESTSKLVRDYGAQVVASSKVVKVTDLLNSSLIPLLLELGIRVRKLVDRYVPKEHRDDFMAGFRMEGKRVVVAVTEIADEP